MISFLTAIVVLVAIGTILQRAEVFSGGGGDEDVVTLVDDQLVVSANSLQKLDIFANDSGLTEAEKESLTILSEPACGRVLARRGVLKYYASDDCAGPQQIVYTLTRMEDPVTATITAFVTSDLHPEIRPDADLTVAGTDTPAAGADATAAGADTPAARTPPGDLAVKETPFRSDDDTNIADATHADAKRPLSEGESRPAPRVAAIERPPLTGGAVEPDAGARLAAVLLEPPAADGPADPTVIAAAPTTDRNGKAAEPERPRMPAKVETMDGGTLSLALVERQRPPDDGPSAIGRPDVLAPEDKISGPRPDAETGVPGPASPRVVAATVPVPASKRLAARDIGADATRATDLAPVTSDAGADALGARPLRRGAGDVTVPRRAPLEGTVAAPADDGMPVAKGLAGVSAPRTGAGTSDASVPVLKDDSSALHHDAPAAGSPRATAEPPVAEPRMAALTPDQKEAPRADLLRRGPEPDPVATRPAPEVLRMAGIVENKVSVGAGGPVAPEAERTVTQVRNTAASSYSFFTPLPRRSKAETDRRILGGARPAGSWAIETGDGPATSVPKVDKVIAALSLPGQSVPDQSPDAALARVPVDADAPPAPGENDPSAGERVAALPDGREACTTPPSAELEIRRAARTVVRIDAPCQADSVAELVYSDFRFAIPLDREGRGSVLALGVEANSAALVQFPDGKVLDFDLPFSEIGRVERIAVVWDVPVALELHALEFGAQTGEDDHVHPGNRRGFKDVRRSGGGFLNTYRSYAGVGQNAQIYTLWKRNGAPDGIVKMMIDFASRSRDRLAGTCGDGTYAAPGFMVIRSSAGRIERPISRRLAAIPCSGVAQEVGAKRLISSAIDDLVVAN